MTLPQLDVKLTREILDQSKVVGYAADWKALINLICMLCGQQKRITQYEIASSIYEEELAKNRLGNASRGTTTPVHEAEVDGIRMWLSHIAGAGAGDHFSSEELVFGKAVTILQKLFKISTDQINKHWDPVVALEALAHKDGKPFSIDFEDISNSSRWIMSSPQEEKPRWQTSKSLPLSKGHRFKLYLNRLNDRPKPVLINLAFRRGETSSHNDIRAQLVEQIQPGDFKGTICWRVSSENNTPMQLGSDIGGFAFLAIYNTAHNQEELFGKKLKSSYLDTEALNHLVFHLHNIEQLGMPATFAWLGYQVS